MKKFYLILVLLAIQKFAFAQTTCIEDLNKPQTTAPRTPQTVKIKNALGEVVDVAIINPWGSDENCIEAGGSPPTPQGKAYNCFSYALYIGQGGPYYGNYGFVVAGSSIDINVVVNCAKTTYVAYSDYNALLRGFRAATASEFTQDGTVIVYTGYDDVSKKVVPLHAAIVHGNNTGMVRQVTALLGIYQETTLASVDNYWVTGRGCSKSYYRLKQPYAADATAGVATRCENIKYCGTTHLYITGPSEFCQETNNNYELGGAKAQGGVYTWSVASGLGINGGTTSATASITGYGSTFQGYKEGVPSKNLSVSVKYKDNCHSENTYSKTVKLKGKVQGAAIVLSSNYSCPTPWSTMTISRNQLGGVSGYDWFLNGTVGQGWSYISGQGTNSLVLYPNGRQYPGYLHIKVQNECGITEPAGATNIFLYNSSNPYGPCGFVPTGSVALENEEEVLDNNEFAFYPNPTSDVIFFRENIQTVEIYDYQGKSVKKAKLNGQLSLDVKDLTPGIYFVEIDGGKEKGKLVISR